LKGGQANDETDKKFIIGSCRGGVSYVVGACGKVEENSKGPAEKAGAAIDQAVDRAKETDWTGDGKSWRRHGKTPVAS
jgi:hypothetical protein